MAEITVDSNRTARISPRWIEQKKGQLNSLTGGESNPNYAPLAQEIADAEEQDRQAKEQHEQLSAKGFRPNQYPGVCTKYGRKVEAMQGYVRKVNGRWVTYCLKAALES